MARAPSKRGTKPRSERGICLDGSGSVIEAVAASRTAGPLVWGRPRVAQSRQQYFDTSGGALAELGITLAVRARGNRFAQSLAEQLDPPIGGYFRRAKSELMLATPEPELARIAHGLLGARLRQLCAGAALVPQLEVAVTATTCRIAFEGATLDARSELGEARAGERSTPIGRICLTLRTGHPSALFRAALLLLEQHPGLKPTRDPVPRLILRASGGARPSPPVAQPNELAKGASLGELIDAVLGDCLRGIARSEEGVRLAPEPEAIHGMRVAVRRFRSALRLLRVELGRPRAERLRDALSALSDALGEVRDLDVFLTWISGCEALGAPPLAELRTRVGRERERALAALFGLLESPERAQLDLELGLLVFGRDWTEAASADRLAVPARDAARSLAERADSRPLRAARDLATLTPAERHRLRLRVKAARYAVELLAPLLPRKRARRYVTRARALQDALGVECDAARTRTLALRLGEAAPPGADFMLGYGAGQAEQSRVDRDRAWRRFRRVPRPWA